MNMKRLFTSIIISLATMPMLAQGWPANYEGVMLQGFYWSGYADSQWAHLEKQADDLSKVFDLVWIPQSGNCGGQSMGYDDFYWFPGEGRYNSSFGTEEELRSLIKTFEQKGIGTIADVVVNHRKNVSNWVDFPKETYKGVTYELKPTDICANDDNGEAKKWATANGYSLSSNNDTGEGWSGMRDLDHKSANVQDNVKAYAKMLIEDLGYVGFRYDMVAGYGGQYTKIYNEYAQPQFSVGECWKGTGTIRNWIDATQNTSAAFDFQFRYTVRNAINTGNWTQLEKQNEGNWPLVSSNYENGKYRRYAVTFVENHDTEKRPDAAQDPIKKDTLAANAYLLAMPGTPCVFLTHWKAYKPEIAKMVAVRKAVGITNMSQPTTMASNTNYYAVVVSGSNGKKLLCVVGKNAATYAPESTWKKILSGYHYAYYVQGIEPSAITLPELAPYQKPEDVAYDGVPSFCTVNDGEICAFFEAPASWGAISQTWAWMKNRDGKEYLGVDWPGVNATLLGKAANGNKVFKWVSAKTTAPDNIIFSGAGGQTKDLPFVNGGYYAKDGLKTTITTGIDLIKSSSVSDKLVRIYTIDGHLLRVLPAGTSINDALNQLGHGVYIINGKKVTK